MHSSNLNRIFFDCHKSKSNYLKIKIKKSQKDIEFKKIREVNLTKG